MLNYVFKAPTWLLLLRYAGTFTDILILFWIRDMRVFVGI